MAFQSNFLDRIPPVTRSLLIVNVIMFVATLINENFMIGTFAMFFPASPLFRWWQPLTHMFMHGGWWHIFFNMYTLVMFGMVVERALGTKKFLILYFVTGFGAAALHTGVEWLQFHQAIAASDTALSQDVIDLFRTPMVGASGAIYGVLVAFAMLSRRLRDALSRGADDPHLPARHPGREVDGGHLHRHRTPHRHHRHADGRGPFRAPGRRPVRLPARLVLA